MKPGFRSTILQVSETFFNRLRERQFLKVGKKFEQKNPRKVTFIGGVCVRGTTAIRFVPPNVKINAEYFVNHVLEPMVREDISKLYPGEEHKVWLHFDSAPKHVARYTYAWLRRKKINFISKED